MSSNLVSKEGVFISFKCELCGNSDLKYIGYINEIPYCRRCIYFKGEEVDNNNFYSSKNFKPVINYHLTPEQIEISNKILEGFKKKEDILVYAVCGAGKTELVFKVITYALKNHLKVGFAIPRKDVVIELARRFQEIFKDNVVTSLYGGNTKLLVGDIIVLTTHQLYRYDHYFDLLILDEIDAFPYRDNQVLEALFKRSVKGNYILMSATPSSETLIEFEGEKKLLLTLFQRYHGGKIPLPEVLIAPFFLMHLTLINEMKKILKENKPLLIFVPTIERAESLYQYLKHLFKKGERVHSKSLKRNEIIEDFRNLKYDYLVTTSILERGVTLANLQVIIFEADSSIYNAPSLIQISGRVGRKADFPNGKVLFLASKKNKEIILALNEIGRLNG
ncbi:MAG TPA: DEAD/DEAH box helicase [Candidatus Onthovivens sp.]|nr:DEAD/DEAH box helicase [Candidatus Onthovivens sp.]